MKNQFPTIRKIIKDYFDYRIDFGRDSAFDELMKTIELGDLKVDDIRNELELLLKSEIDWREFGINTYLLTDRPEFTNDIMKNHLLYCIYDIAWPKKAFTMCKREELVVVTYEILRNFHYEKESGWLFYKDLYNELRLLKTFKELEFFNLNHLLIDGRGVFDLRLIDTEKEKLFQISVAEFCLPHNDIYEVREPNEKYPPYLL